MSYVSNEEIAQVLFTRLVNKIINNGELCASASKVFHYPANDENLVSDYMLSLCAKRNNRIDVERTDEQFINVNRATEYKTENGTSRIGTSASVVKIPTLEIITNDIDDLVSSMLQTPESMLSGIYRTYPNVIGTDVIERNVNYNIYKCASKYHSLGFSIEIKNHPHQLTWLKVYPNHENVASLRAEYIEINDRVNAVRNDAGSYKQVVLSSKFRSSLKKEEFIELAIKREIARYKALCAIFDNYEISPEMATLITANMNNTWISFPWGDGMYIDVTK